MFGCCKLNTMWSLWCQHSVPSGVSAWWVSNSTSFPSIFLTVQVCLNPFSPDLSSCCPVHFSQEPDLVEYLQLPISPSQWKRFRGYLSSSSGQWSLQGFESKWEEWSECPVQALRWESSAFYKCFLSRRHFIVACKRLLTVLWGNNVLHFLVQYFVETWFWGNKS